MEIFLIIVQAFIALAMIGFILLQKNEGGGLVSQQGGQSMSRFMTRRSQADFLTRTTTILATAFMSICLLIAVISNQNSRRNSLLEQVAKERQSAPDTKAVPETKEVDAEPVNPTANQPSNEAIVTAPTEGLNAGSNAVSTAANGGNTASAEDAVAAPNNTLA